MSTPPACIPLPQNPLWRFHPETLDVRHSRSGAVALTFTMNKRRLAKITSPSGTEILVEVPAALPPGLLPVPGYPEYGFSQAEGRVYRAHGGWATFIPRALVPHRKKACHDLYVWLIPSKGMGKKRQVSLARIAKAIASEQGLDYAWLRQNLPEGDHSGPSRASDPEPTGAQHGASLIDADTTISERPRFLSNREVAHLRLPVVDGWYWWRASDESRSTRRYVTDGGKQAFTPEGHRSTPFDMGGEWGYRAHAPGGAPEGDLNPAPDTRFPQDGGATRYRVPMLAGWYWWREAEGASVLRYFVEEDGKRASSEEGDILLPTNMGGEWGLPAPAPCDPHPEPCNLHPEPGNLEDNPIPEPAYLPGAELDKIHAEMLKAQSLEPLPSPFDLYPEGDPRWTEGEPETVEAPTPVPVFQPRIF